MTEILQQRQVLIQPGLAERDPKTFLRRRTSIEFVLSLATPLIFLLAWEGTARSGWLDARFFPAPTSIVGSLGEMAASGVLQKDLVASIMRILPGFALGVTCGLIAALALGLSRYARAALEPFLSALYTVPKLALLPLLLLIFGLGEFPKILLVAMAVFFQVWISCMDAIINIPETYREAARSFGAGRWQMFRHVTWPALLPQLFVNMRISIGIAVLVVVGVEFVQASEGIGYRIWHSWSLFQADRMYVGICVIAVLGFIFGYATKRLSVWALPWARMGSGKA